VGHDRSDRPFLAAFFQGAVITFADTAKTALTEAAVQMMLTLNPCMDLMRACGGAGTTVTAAVKPKLQFRRLAPSLGIMTPKTAQRTAFKENGGANARAIMNGITLNIEDYAGVVDVR
jgi:hypothetical protein